MNTCSAALLSSTIQNLMRSMLGMLIVFHNALHRLNKSPVSKIQGIIDLLDALKEKDLFC